MKILINDLDPQNERDDDRSDEEIATAESAEEDAMVAHHERYEDEDKYHGE